jgi:hypothetical protein
LLGKDARGLSAATISRLKELLTHTLNQHIIAIRAQTPGACNFSVLPLGSK